MIIKPLCAFPWQLTHHPLPNEKVLRQPSAASSRDINLTRFSVNTASTRPRSQHQQGNIGAGLTSAFMHLIDQSDSLERIQLPTNEPCMVWPDSVSIMTGRLDTHTKSAYNFLYAAPPQHRNTGFIFTVSLFPNKMVPLERRNSLWREK